MIEKAHEQIASCSVPKDLEAFAQQVDACKTQTEQAKVMEQAHLTDETRERELFVQSDPYEVAF